MLFVSSALDSITKEGARWEREGNGNLTMLAASRGASHIESGSQSDGCHPSSHPVSGSLPAIADGLPEAQNDVKWKRKING